MSEERRASPAVHSLSALGASVLATSLTHPLDLVKARFQVQHVQHGGAVPYRNTLQALLLIGRSEGLAGLYRGLAPSLVGNGAAWGLYMFFFSELKQRVFGTVPPGASLPALGVAALAGAGSAALTNPIWVVKVRLQSQPHDAVQRYEGMWDALRTISREEGVRGLWRGLTPALIGTSHGAVQMVSYEWMRGKMWHRKPDMTPKDYLLLGTVSKIIASLTTFPYQLIKTRMQVRDLHFRRHNSIMETVRSVYASEGLAGFYRGVFPATFRTIPHAAIMFSSYEWLRSALSQTKL